jgi:hypothetical protein
MFALVKLAPIKPKLAYKKIRRGFAKLADNGTGFCIFNFIQKRVALFGEREYVWGCVKNNVGCSNSEAL